MMPGPMAMTNNEQSAAAATSPVRASPAEPKAKWQGRLGTAYRESS